MPGSSKIPVLTAAELDQAFVRLADEIEASARDAVLLVGIQKGGVPVAEKLAELLSGRVALSLGRVDVAFHRDDLDRRLPVPETTELPASIDGRDLLLVDDVIETGRTVRAAIDAIREYGRPARIRLAVVLDRGGRELPITPNFIGATAEASVGSRLVLTAQGVMLEPRTSR